VRKEFYDRTPHALESERGLEYPSPVGERLVHGSSDLMIGG